MDEAGACLKAGRAVEAHMRQLINAAKEEQDDATKADAVAAARVRVEDIDGIDILMNVQQLDASVTSGTTAGPNNANRRRDGSWVCGHSCPG